jgi:hypothetical protein
MVPPNIVIRSVGHAVGRVPGLRRVPLVKLLAAAELAVLARDHLMRLTPADRRRLVSLARAGRGRRRNLSADERDELAKLIAKVEPRLLAGAAAERLSPVPLPRRLLFGPHR